ncbi:hypothetical protein HBI21_158360 [Parastagonospora nodorum]|nr:hypothetical protein HBI21_158360 [Parastagonospora nodorum]
MLYLHTNLSILELAANKLPCLASIVLLKLLKKILLIAIRIYYCVILYYLVYKHSCLLTYYSLIYIRIISRDKVTYSIAIYLLAIFKYSYRLLRREYILIFINIRDSKSISKC